MEVELDEGKQDEACDDTVTYNCRQMEERKDISLNLLHSFNGFLMPTAHTHPTHTQLVERVYILFMSILCIILYFLLFFPFYPPFFFIAKENVPL